MISKMKFLLLIFFVFINPLFNHLKSQEIGKYAILIFGGKTDPKKGGSDEELYVQFEMAEMYKTLLNYYEYDNSDIYVHNLSGDKNSSGDYYQYFSGLK